MKFYWCTSCKAPVPKNIRIKRAGGRGWLCPDCNVGLPRYPIEIINESPDLEELLQ